MRRRDQNNTKKKVEQHEEENPTMDGGEFNSTKKRAE